MQNTGKGDAFDVRAPKTVHDVVALNAYGVRGTKEREVTMKRFVTAPFLVCVFLLFGCAAQYSSIKSDFQLDNTNNGGTIQIIVGSPPKILSALSDIIDQEFIVYSRRINADNGSLLFKGKGTGALRGDVQVTIKLKQTAGTDKKGETIKGYSFDVLSEGIGFNSSMLPQYAINNINEAFLKSLPEYNLSLVRVNNPKIEKYQIQQEVFVKEEDTEKKPDITLAGGLSVDVDMHIPEGEKAGRYDIAVIIGNKNYKNIPNVEYADRDAVIMKVYLTEHVPYMAQRLKGTEQQPVIMGNDNDVMVVLKK